MKTTTNKNYGNTVVQRRPFSEGVKRHIEIYTDGASRGNPGPSAIGIFIKDGSGREIIKKGEYLGETTNNVAEYTAVIRGLKYLLNKKLFKITNIEVIVNTDSELLVNQLNGNYRIKSQNLIPLAIEARGLLKKFPKVKFNLIARKENKIADKLANKSMNLHDDIEELVEKY
ncbi:MAG: ribonuclease HI family protein [Planctomycetota bacterium]